MDAALRVTVTGRSGSQLVGLSCLADGADTLFARAVLDAGGALVVVVPAAEYRAGLPESHHPTYDCLIKRAAEVIRLDHTTSDSQAHMDASLHMIKHAD